MINPEAAFVETGALVVAAALQGDEDGVRLLLHSLPDQHVRAVCEGAVCAMALLLADHLPDQALARAITEARAVAHQASTEGEPS
ncbi:hypothetical protein [Streptomyces sp. SGAir0957]